MAIAFFDLDLTLLSRNSGSMWVRSELRDGFISPWMALRAASWILRYQLGMAEMEYALLEAVKTLEGDDEATVRDRTHRFYDREVAHLYRPGGLAALERHRRAGDRLVLLTSSSNYMSEKAQEQLGLDDILCNRFQVRDGVFTGLPEGDLCFGQGKLAHASRLAAAAGADLGDCHFYTDSTSDLSVLDVVGHPVVIHPDPRLRRIASARGWRREDWGEPDQR
ncbi:MAG: HAD-IB family hydrolase [Proteobacteria bacterium]|nr:HAD-IB family hydrolase [Pseudomonadota bacterium]MCP4917573.1 HAD-IB family hydrolase [Pseudomonadota bacterium]